MIYILILTINILLLYFIDTDKKYFLVTIPLWTILIVTLIYWRSYNDNKIDRIETSYWKSAENKIRGEDKLWEQLNKSKSIVQKDNMTFLQCILLQTILTFIFQVVGYRSTANKKVYKWTSIIFGILTLINLLLQLMIGIVPTGGIVG